MKTGGEEGKALGLEPKRAWGEGKKSVGGGGKIVRKVEKRVRPSKGGNYNANNPKRGVT